jgi:hypothetical protein
MIKELTNPRAWLMLIGLFAVADSLTTYAAFSILGANTPEQNSIVHNLWFYYGPAGVFLWLPFEFLGWLAIVGIFAVAFWFGKKAHPPIHDRGRLVELISDPSRFITAFLFALLALPIFNVVQLVSMAVFRVRLV